MTKRSYATSILFLTVLLNGGLLAQNPPELTLKELLEKNMLAAGGREKLSGLKDFTFKVEPYTFYCTPGGLLKVTAGKAPVITEVIIISGDTVKRNCFNQVTEMTGLDKARWQTLARLYSGLFTIKNFETQFTFKGLKTFGPQQLYLLAGTVSDLNVEFYLETQEFMLKRLVFLGQNPDGEKYEVNYDFGPFQEVDGLNLPSSWFASQVGTRGNLYELTDVKLNPGLDKDFLSSIEVNVGEVKIAQGSLKGNVIDFNTRFGSLVITTNWTEECIAKAGFKTGDRLTLSVGGLEPELVFYASSQDLPPRQELSKGAQVMFFDRRFGETYVIAFYTKDLSQLTEKLTTLAPIEATKK